MYQPKHATKKLYNRLRAKYKDKLFVNDMSFDQFFEQRFDHAAWSIYTKGGADHADNYTADHIIESKYASITLDVTQEEYDRYKRAADSADLPVESYITAVMNGLIIHNE